MLKTNEKRLVQFALQGQVEPPTFYGWETTRTGQAKYYPATGGITYNVKVGDSCFGFEADHVEPALSCIAGNPNERSKNPNLGFVTFSCVGNEAVVLSGRAKGKKGIVTGSHGGVEHLMIDFADEVLEKLTYDDKILVKGFGQGLALLDFPEISLMGISPFLLKKMPIKTKGKKLSVPVTARVPAELMGSGLGHNDSYKGDYDIQTGDEAVLIRHGLDKLRLGDFVAIIDNESTFGWSYKKGAVSVGIVVHGNSHLAGHGPGVHVLMTSRTGKIEPIINPKANIADYLKIGRMRRRTSR